MKNIIFLLLLSYYCYGQEVIPPQYDTDYSTEAAASRPHLSIKYKGETFGFLEGNILKLDNNGKEWNTYIATPLYIGSAAVFEDKLIITEGGQLNLYAVDLINKTITPYNLPPKLFIGKKAVKFDIEVGSSGCFHRYSNSRSYVLKKDNFKYDSKKGRDSSFRAMNKTINPAVLKDIINEADLSRNKKITLADLEITQKDIDAFKELLTVEQKGYQDFESIYQFQDTALNFYRTTADSLNKISPEIINRVFKKSSGLVCTTTNWQKLVITFEDGSQLSIENSDWVPGYYYTPWTVNYNGLYFETNSITLGKMFDQLTGGKLLEDKYKDKKYAIYKITDYLYNKSLERE